MGATETTPCRKAERRGKTGAAPAIPRARAMLIALNQASGLPRSSLCRLGRELGRWLGESGDAALEGELEVPPGSLERATAVRRQAEEIAAREEERAASLGASVLTLVDADYPRSLLDLSLPPPVLYVLGTLPAAPAVTIIGSRRVDLYGLAVAEAFGRDLAAAGAVVVSGFAHGVDAAAHRGALTAAGGRTVAVLGCGLAVDYPRGHARLARQIAERGALISEFPPGTAPAQWQFPVRNRILAALAQATLVIRATPRSGSLITVRHALDLGRDVYAIPGRIHEPGSQGPNGLIRDGAFLAQDPRDILENLDPPLGIRPPRSPHRSDRERESVGEAALSAPSSPLLAVLAPDEARTTEELALATGWPVERVVSELLTLELAGDVRRRPGGGYARRP
jgi:DNA processing protein